MDGYGGVEKIDQKCDPKFNIDPTFSTERLTKDNYLSVQ